MHPNFLKPFFFESNVSDYILGAVLFQKGDDKRLRPVAFHSWKITPVEINYSVYQSQEPWIFHLCSGIESTSSSLEYIVISLQFYDHGSPWIPTKSIQYLVKSQDVHILHPKNEMQHIINNILFSWSPSGYFSEPCIL
jgi:hypothetical protein